MEFRNALDSRRELFRIWKLYRHAFPAEERAPFLFLVRGAGKGRAEFLSIYKGTQWVGFVYLLTKNDLSYIFYLAISEKQRGKGCGTETVRSLIDRCGGGRLFLALERQDEKADNYAQRISRHRFYEGCGLQDLPYFIKEGNVIYAIMGTGGAVEPEEYTALISDWCGPEVLKRVDMKILKTI